MTISVEADKKVAEEKPKEQVSTEPVQEESQDKINWKKFREEREKERKALDEERKRSADKGREAEALKAAMEALLAKPEKSSQANDSSEETEETRVSRLVRDEINKDRKLQEEERQRREAAQLPQQLQQTFSDYNKVCTEENVDYLEYHYPEITEGFKHMPNGFSKWSAVYKAIKRFVPNPDSKKEEKKIEKNLTKPQSMSSSGMTHTGDHAPVMTSEKARQDNWLRMSRIMKGGKA